MINACFLAPYFGRLQRNRNWGLLFCLFVRLKWLQYDTLKKTKESWGFFLFLSFSTSTCLHKMCRITSCKHSLLTHAADKKHMLCFPCKQTHIIHTCTHRGHTCHWQSLQADVECVPAACWVNGQVCLSAGHYTLGCFDVCVCVCKGEVSETAEGLCNPLTCLWKNTRLPLTVAELKAQRTS